MWKNNMLIQNKQKNITFCLKKKQELDKYSVFHLSTAPLNMHQPNYSLFLIQIPHWLTLLWIWNTWLCRWDIIFWVFQHFQTFSPWSEFFIMFSHERPATVCANSDGQLEPVTSCQINIDIVKSTMSTMVRCLWHMCNHSNDNLTVI